MFAALGLRSNLAQFVDARSVSEKLKTQLSVMLCAKRIVLIIICYVNSYPKDSFLVFATRFIIHAAVVTFVAGSLEAGGLPGSLEILEALK